MAHPARIASARVGGRLSARGHSRATLGCMPRVPAHTDVEFIRPAGLPGVELRYSRYQTSAFRTHTHPVWSVALIETGSTTFTVPGKRLRGSAGHLVVIPPGVAHACNPEPGDAMTYRMFYLPRDWFAPHDEGAGYPTFGSPVIEDPHLYGLWSHAWSALVSAPAAIECPALNAAVALLIERHATPTRRPASTSDVGAIEQAKRLMRERLEQRVTLEHLAAETCMSRSHLSRVFRAAEGLPPHAYHNQLRVERAKELLAAGEPASTVAAAVGFSDQSHLSRVFREFTGATPSQYQDDVSSK